MSPFMVTNEFQLFLFQIQEVEVFVPQASKGLHESSLPQNNIELIDNSKSFCWLASTSGSLVLKILTVTMWKTKLVVTNNFDKLKLKK